MQTVTVPHLRPLTVGQILDRAIRLYRNHFKTFLAIVAVVQIPLGLVQLGNALVNELLTSDTFIGEAWAAAILAMVNILSAGLILVGFVVNQIAAAALARSVADVYLGRKTGFAVAYRSITPLLGNLIITLLILTVTGIGLFIFALVPLIGWFPGAGMLIFFGWIIAPMVGPILILEKRAGFDVLRRAWDLARRRFWQVFGFGFVLVLFGGAITLGPSLLLNYLVSFVWSGFDPSAPLTPSNIPDVPIWGVVLQTITNVSLQTILLPVQLAAASVLYFDLRVRTEGLDLELLSAQQADEALDMDTILQSAPRPRQDQLVVSDEWIGFGAVGCGCWVFFGLVFVVFWGILIALIVPTLPGL